VHESEMYSKEYSTSQWLALAPPVEVWCITLQGPVDIDLDVELLNPIAAQKLSSKGASFAHADMIRTRSLDGLGRALPLLQQVPSLAATFGALAKSIHILEASEPGFDVSYSDPSIPFSVFLNISEGRFADLRTAEALVHEAMHLQLSLIERLVPIAKVNQGLHYSPWKLSQRPVAGLMHALYVFRVIDQWLDHLPKISEETKDYAEKRRKEIKEEIEQLASASFVPHLTVEGQQLLSRLLA
jgi:HEXXH motif-containing protein